MPRLVRENVDSGRTKTYNTEFNCLSCGTKLNALDTNCPRCGSPRPASLPISQLKKGEELRGQDLERVKSGGGNCKYCGTFTYNYDHKKNGYVCPSCSAGTGEKSDAELAGDTSQPAKSHSTPAFIPAPVVNSTTSSSGKIPTWQIIVGGTGAFLLISLCVWLLILIITPHNVAGYVSSVNWARSARQEENQLKSGEGFGLPQNATPIGTPESRIARYKDNVVSTAQPTYFVTSTPKVIDTHYGTKYVDSTPEVIGHTHSMIPAETPGDYYDGPDYDCGDPTVEPGNAITYRQCHAVYQEDSTWGEVESEETPEYAPVVQVEVTTQATYVYADPVDVVRTTEPTLIYGTPTPIFEDYYWYTYWEWTFIEELRSSGQDNNAYWPTGTVDEYHRVINGNEQYQVTIQYENGHTETYTGTDYALIQKYILGEPVIGQFNVFGWFMKDDQ